MYLLFNSLLAFDRAGNLYVANVANNTIAKFAPDGVGSVFVSAGLDDPFGLAFQPVPEPTTSALVLAGVAVLGWTTLQRRRVR